MGRLELRVYPGSKCSGSVYGDDGHSFDYKHGGYTRTSFSCTVNSDGISVDIGPRQGSFVPWWKQIEVVVYGWNTAHATATLKGNAAALKTRVDAASHSVHVVIPENAEGSQLTLTAK